MTQKCALAISLLKGEVISIMNGFSWFSMTNAPREIGRSIERSFGVKVDRKMKHFESKYGNKGWYFEYRLMRTRENKDGIEKMSEYVAKITKSTCVNSSKKGKKIVDPSVQIHSEDLFS